MLYSDNMDVTHAHKYLYIYIIICNKYGYMISYLYTAYINGLVVNVGGLLLQISVTLEA